MSWLLKPSFCSFVTPTLGRKTLQRTIQSLLDQPDWNWLSYIVFDGVDPISITGLNPDINYLEDNHFIVTKVDKIGHAGLVRNEVLSMIETTWTAFLDDDDWLAPTYLEKLREYSSNNSELDIIIFSYYDAIHRNLQPPPKTVDFKRCQVGISFAIKTEFIKDKDMKFEAGGIEDFAFLDSARSKGAKYLITNDIQYHVGGRGVWKFNG